MAPAGASQGGQPLLQGPTRAVPPAVHHKPGCQHSRPELLSTSPSVKPHRMKEQGRLWLWQGSEWKEKHHRPGAHAHEGKSPRNRASTASAHRDQPQGPSLLLLPHQPSSPPTITWWLGIGPPSVRTGGQDTESTFLVGVCLPAGPTWPGSRVSPHCRAAASHGP